MSRKRADLVLVARGFAESRAKAQAAIEAGGVRVAGATITKASDLIEEEAFIEFTPPHPWVSRGGIKLAHALDVFGVSPEGRVCLDVGASTGGFTQVLAARGAARIYAVDVGHGQLHPSLHGDPRIVSIERTDARSLGAAHFSEPPSLVVCDVSFIGVTKALALPLALAASEADLVALIKPQFEAGPKAGRAGVLDEASAHAAADAALASLDGMSGFRVLARTISPIRGGDGNIEFLAHARR